MKDTLATLSREEFEQLVEQAIDRRLKVWLTQLTDALLGTSENGDNALQPEFAASLRQALEQARSGEAMDLDAFRNQLGQ